MRMARRAGTAGIEKRRAAMYAAGSDITRSNHRVHKTVVIRGVIILPRGADSKAGY